MPVKEMCRQVGITPKQLAQWKKQSDGFNTALQREHLRSQQVANIDRKTVIRGLLEAVDMAKDMRQPGGMISGWKEVGRMCGFYEPERREINLSVSSKQLIEQMRNMPREKLLELSANSEEAIEAEFEVVER